MQDSRYTTFLIKYLLKNLCASASLRAFYFITILLCSCTQNPSQTQPPNVLFIAVDDMNDWVSILGDSNAKTPNLTRLANMGMNFTNAHCPSPNADLPAQPF